MSNSTLQKSEKRFSLRIYDALLRLYPAAFRKEYGGDMRQSFADQHRDESRAGGFLPIGRLWLRILIDLACSIPLQHLNEIKGNMNTKNLFQRSANVPFMRLVGLTASCLIFAVVVTTLMLPKTYLSIARLSVTPASQPEAVSDAYQMQVVFETMQSKESLEAVAQDIRANSHISGRPAAADSNEPLPFDLAKMIHLRQSRNTSLVEVLVYAPDGRLGAYIANKFGEVFKRNHPEYQVNIIDRAEPGMRPIRPNIPLSLVSGSLFSLLAALVLAGVLRIIFRLTVGPIHRSVAT